MPETINDRFDKKWWYDNQNLRLCSKDVPFYDEDENFVKYVQNAAAVPKDIKSFIAEELDEIEKEIAPALKEKLELSNVMASAST